MSSTLDGVDGMFLSQICVALIADKHKQAVRVINGSVAKRFVGEGNNALAIFAGRLGDQLLSPGAERCNRWRTYHRELVTSEPSKNADGQAKLNRRILRRRHIGSATARHDECV